MSFWNWVVLAAFALAAAGALYVRLRWRRSPQAYRAMMALAACYFVAGSLTSAWVLHLLTSSSSQPPLPASGPAAVASPVAAASPPNARPAAFASPESSFDFGSLHYDPVHAVLPNPKLTPGDVFPGVTAGDVCTPGWSSDHRHVTEGMRDKIYAEYGRERESGCCEVDHLIPLELGGSNDIKNLWPEPENPRPGDAEKDQLENELHRLVCTGKMPLTEAQQCIATNWVQCWEKYDLPSTGTASR
jgi:hypothetical protein